MNSPKGNTMTNIKQEIDGKQRKRYANMREQKNINFYNLYKPKIVTIQRWWRNCMIKKVQKLERIVLNKLQTKRRLERANLQKKKEFEDIKQRRHMLLYQNENENEFVMLLEKQIAAKLRRALNGTLDSAEQLARNNGQIRYVLEQIKDYQNKGETLEGELQALKFEHDCHKERKRQWQQKLCNIKENILSETLKAKDIRNKINQLQNKKHDEAMKSKLDSIFN